ncbi:MAG: tRNA pseudouridine(13) synthase TruD [Planctomycetota bacterium]|nr:tRNA pseudouridine(13) synthase TruD [Planctomycetota bacterium]
MPEAEPTHNPSAAAPLDPTQGANADPHVQPAAYLTASVPGIGGHIKERAEDFIVDEVPLYQPSGDGEHIYLYIEKKGLSTTEMLTILMRHFGVGRIAVGVAGMKDKRAMTRQVVSLHAPGKRLEDFPMLRHERLFVHWADYHNNKLRTGHLLGNRFSIRVRGVEPTSVVRAKKSLDLLEASGVPNRYGEQRFGNLGNNHLVGRAMILGQHERAIHEWLGIGARRGVQPHIFAEARDLADKGQWLDAAERYPLYARAERRLCAKLGKGVPPHDALASVDEPFRRFMISAFQSAVFNIVLDKRLDAGTLDTLLPGDIALHVDDRRLRRIDDTNAADPALREALASKLLSPSGPMWGARMPKATGDVLRTETEALAELGVTPADLIEFQKHSGRLIDGSRRPLRVPLIDPAVEGGVDEHGAFVRLAFEMPRGSFATVVLREVIKPKPGQSLEDDSPGESDELEESRG